MTDEQQEIAPDRRADPPSGGPDVRPAGSDGAPPGTRLRTLVLGEALVDLVCERPVASFAEADAFVPHFGGASANVAVTIAREGGRVALAGAVGRDRWGDWLFERLAGEDVDRDWLLRRADVVTPVAFVTVDADAEPSYAFYGSGLTPGFPALAGRIAQAVGACDAVFLATNMQVGADERAVTRAARERALELGVPVVFDPNLRLDLWGDASEAITVARACVPGAYLVKANRDEVRLLTGHDDPAAGARALRDAGARHVVVTLGADGALLAGEAGERRVPGVPARPVNATGAGDAIAGVLLARLARDGYADEAVAAALPDAVAAAARSTERWGAVS